MSGRADIAQRRLLRALLPAIGPSTVIATRSVPWSSATFEGARHRIALRIEGPDARERAAALPRTIGELEIAMPGAFVADIVVTTRIGGRTDDSPPAIAIEALTIDEPESDVAAAFSRSGPRAC